jgi:outer membrane protein assembly factor BamB
MFKKSTSKNKRRRAVLYGAWFVLVLLFGVLKNTAGQGKLNFTEPFKRCWVYGGNNGLSRIIASDNESNIILTSDNFALISINPSTNLENWKSLAGGKIEAESVTDENNLYFVTSFENESKRKNYTLNSISLKTGITNWQKKILDYSKFKLNETKNKEFLFLVADEKSLSAVWKSNGETRWTKDFISPIQSVNASKNELLNIILEDRLLRALISSGEISAETNLKTKAGSHSIIRDTYLLVGYPNGEISKITAERNKSEIIWRIKTGGGISGLVEYEDEILVTSLDNFIYLFSNESGKLKWKKRVAGRINIEPIVSGNFSIIANSGDNSSSIIDLRDGKVVNQIRLEADNYFSGPPLVAGAYVVLQTSRGMYFFINAGVNCK